MLRAYDAKGHFDETAPQPLWLVYGETTPARRDADADAATSCWPATARATWRAATFRSAAARVKVQGSGIPPEHTVWVAGPPVPVDAHGNFVAEEILPAGTHTVEVAVLDEAGNG